jgi:hypothetical protein
MNFVITTTACLRPELLNETYSSFRKFMNNGDKFERVVINIDPVGNGSIKKMKKVCLKHFIYSSFITPDTANFASAFVNVWSTALNQYLNNDFIFNLEDDWELTKPVDLEEIEAIFRDFPKLAFLRLSNHTATERTMKCWNKYIPWNGRFFQCPDNLKGVMGFCGHPAFIRREFVSNTLPLINPTLNPEKQFHADKKILEEVYKWDYGVYADPNTSPYIHDIGRRWMVDNGFRKKGIKAFFTNWEKGAVQ